MYEVDLVASRFRNLECRNVAVRMAVLRELKNTMVRGIFPPNAAFLTKNDSDSSLSIANPWTRMTTGVRLARLLARLICTLSLGLRPRSFRALSRKLAGGIVNGPGMTRMGPGNVRVRYSTNKRSPNVVQGRDDHTVYVKYSEDCLPSTQDRGSVKGLLKFVSRATAVICHVAPHILLNRRYMYVAQPSMFERDCRAW